MNHQWIFNPTVRRKILQDQFKGTLEYRILKDRLETLFADDAYALEFVFTEPDEWDGEHHYWHWLGSKDDKFIKWWVNAHLGRIPGQVN